MDPASGKRICKTRLSLFHTPEHLSCRKSQRVNFDSWLSNKSPEPVFLACSACKQEVPRNTSFTAALEKIDT